MDLFLSPHNDDETLFGAFTLMAVRPHVVVCLRSFVQEIRGGPSYQEREAETHAAMEILGCQWSQMVVPDSAPHVSELRGALEVFEDAERVYAPAFEIGGHEHHNLIADLAEEIFGARRVIHYYTYRRGNARTHAGARVPWTPEMLRRKMAALACYRSQIVLPGCAEHFIDCQYEFVA